ncbi:MAG: quinone-dependent dihydroorotate dehydrogenase [Anaerolineae bacterium]
MYPFLRPLIFRLPAERAHELTLALLRLAGSSAAGRWLVRALFAPRPNGPAVHAFGLTFANPVGLAAGYDKDGLGWRGLAAMGFGHLELGTVTPRPQPGNPAPRIFRLVEDRAVINRMGFPSRGADFLARRLAGRRPASVVIGVNIGKNKDTPLERAVEDYRTLLQRFAPLADYLAINVSSPNTPGLRRLQDRAALFGLLQPLAEERRRLADALGRPVPLLVKLAPDLADAALEAALDAILAAGMDGVIISNTTLRRDGLRSAAAGETGGLSGAPLRGLSSAMVRRVADAVNGRLPIVASGGVMSADDAEEKLAAGAALVQLYTGLIYAGPGLVRQICATLHA